jgi:two-component system LytT family sensor kinase
MISFSILKIRTFKFWHFQTAGWIAFYLSDLFLLLTIKEWTPLEFIEESLEFVVGFILTCILRYYYRSIRYQQSTILAIIGRVTIFSIITTFIWYLITLGQVSLMIPFQLPMVSNLNYLFVYMITLSPVMFGWSTLYFGIKFSMEWEEQKRRTEKAQLLAQGAQLQMLRYQLNPHFLFNALNSIRALINEDTRSAKSMITELSEFLRYSLVNRNPAVVTLKAELDAIRHYLSIEKKRYEDKLEITFTIDPATEDDYLLSFLIHPLVENAIKYGMSTSPMPLRIHITTEKEKSTLRITVVNSGSWINAGERQVVRAAGTGTGLENIRARLENAYPGKHALLTFERDGFVHSVVELSLQPQSGIKG